MKDKLQGILIGMMISFLLTCSAVFAKQGVDTLEVAYSNIKIFLNGNQLNPTDAKGITVEPFIANGTTYVPLRSVSEAFGLPVEWDGENGSIYLGTKSSTIDSKNSNVDENKDLLNYSNTKYSLKVKYPKSWSVEEDVKENSAMFISPVAGTIVIFSVEELSDQSVNLEEYKEELIKEISKSLTDFKLVSSQKSTLAGRNAYEIVFTSKEDPYLLNWKLAYFIENDKLYLSTITTHQSSSNEVLSDINEIIKSLQID